VPHISIVNLLAGRELFPEYLLDRDEPELVGRHVVEWLTDPAARQRVLDGLTDLKQQVARPGACETAARFLCETYGRRANRLASGVA